MIKASMLTTVFYHSTGQNVKYKVETMEKHTHTKHAKKNSLTYLLTYTLSLIFKVKK